MVLISTYEMGRQPFGLASPAAWLRRDGASVSMLDLATTHYEPSMVRAADLVALYLPMHTATRLADKVIDRVRIDNPNAHIACYGLYAPLNESYLLSRGADTVIAGEFERALVDLYRAVCNDSSTAEPGAQEVPKGTRFLVPDREGLPDLGHYGTLQLGDGLPRVTGYTEATRGCKHACRHCPVVPVYEGRFYVVPPDVVLDDIRRQVDAGATHITFGDPDFLNGPAHARRVVTRLHEEFPEVTYDATIKVEHLLQQSHLLPMLRETGCVLVTSAFESFDDRVLSALDKGHTAADLDDAVSLLAEAGLALNATFVSFTPWTGRPGYLEMLHSVARLGLVGSIAPIQYAVRLLVVAGSGLLELEDVREMIGPFDESTLAFGWDHPDPVLDELHADLLELVERDSATGSSRPDTFRNIWDMAHDALAVTAPDLAPVPAPATVPYFTEPWFC